MIRGAVAVAALAVSCYAWAGQDAVRSGDEAATKAAEITQTYALSKNKTECLLFDTADKGRYFLIRVRENHTEACGGEVDVSPVLFFLKIRKRDGHAVTTAYDSEHYEPLRRPSSK
ncbi:MAG: hypothetical protein LBV73_15170 [Paraburkholderia sp.]|jgi:hypothetical protein|nr:hypothetical protein [Paraburkholderia sp.]